MNKPLASILLAAGLGASAIAPAQAAVSPAKSAVETVVINVSDLDLDTPEDVRALEARVGKAVRQVCRVVDIDTGYRLINRDVRKCLAKARASAERQVAALISEEEQQRGG